jgi:hypothetical protein
MNGASLAWPGARLCVDACICNVPVYVSRFMDIAEHVRIYYSFYRYGAIDKLLRAR